MGNNGQLSRRASEQRGDNVFPGIYRLSRSETRGGEKGGERGREREREREIERETDTQTDRQKIPN